MTDDRTITRERTPGSDGHFDVRYVGRTTLPTEQGRTWPGPYPEAVIHDMDAALGPQAPDAYRVVEGT